MAVGDWVLSIDGENAGGLTHIEAQNKIRACGERLSLGLSRYAGAEQAWQVGMPLGLPINTPFPSLLGPSRLRANRRRYMRGLGHLGGRRGGIGRPG